jgi:fibronectin-binding autotransporter adhesin
MQKIMNRIKKSTFVRRAALSAMLAGAMASTANAQTSAWNTNTSTNWGTASSWVGSSIANGVGNTANFTFNITAALTVTNSTARTIGNITFTDATTSHDMTIAGTNVLTLDVNLNQSQINVTQSGRILTISAPLAGSDGVQKLGAGQLTLSGNNTISGNFLVDAGTLVPASANALGTTTLIYNTASTGTTAFTGGITYANNITAFSGVTGSSGLGLIRHTGTGGVATLTGTISLLGSPSAGGTFGGSNTAGQELRINGAINDGTNFSQRNGRVIYAGGGNSVGTFTLTDTALLGANNGLPQGMSLLLGGSGLGTLNLNGFSQTINNTSAATYALRIANGGNAGTLELSTGTLTLNGDLQAAGTAASTINSGAAGTLALGATPRIFQVDNTTANGLAINNATITGSGGITKNGTGNMTLNAATFNNALTFNTGTLRGNGSFNSGLTANTGTTINPGSVVATGSMSASTLAFAAGTQTVITPITNLGANSSITVSAANGLTNAGAVTMQINQVGGLIPNGTYNLINYTGTSPTLTGFTVAPVGHVVGSLVDSGTAIQYVVTGNDKVTWTGITDANWDTTTLDNWKTVIGNTSTTYVRNDAIVFGDGGLNTTINAGSTPLEPTTVEFTNTSTGPIYNISGTGTSGITGVTPITQTGTGSNVLNMPAHTTTGALTVSAGTLEMRQASTANYFGIAGSPISVSSPGTLRIIGNDVGFNIARNITGNGTVFVDANSSAGTAHNATINFTGDNSAFSGTLILGNVTAGQAAGTWRTDGSTSPADLGLTSTVQVQSGAQLWVGAGTFNNNITITGVGSAETAGGTTAQNSVGLAAYATDYPDYSAATFSGIGAIRMSANSILAGTVTLNGSAKIGPFGTTGVISGSVNTTGVNDVLVVGGGSSANTLVLTGTNNVGANSLKRVWVGSGGTAVNQTLQIGNNGTTGTLGTGDVILYGQNAGGSAILDFRRSDGYTLDANQKIYAAINDATSTTNPHDAAARPYQTSVAVNTTGTGLTIGAGHVIDLADNTTNTDGAGFLTVGTAISGATLNINTGAIVDVGVVYVGQNAFNSTINQSGADVLIRNQLRVGNNTNHTSTYNLTGGSITLTGASPSNSPSTAGGGGNASNGDNNLNTLATAIIEGGGIYLGVEGRGIFNQSGTSTVNTNWVVLDNRTSTDTGTGITGGGIDQYNLNGGTLNLRSTYGLHQRLNNTAEFNLGGGTVRVDNNGTGTGTGPNIIVPIDSVVNVTGTASILDTNASVNTGNSILLSRNVLGTGTVTTQGGGNLVLDPSYQYPAATAGANGGGNGNQLITANIAGNSPVVKQGVGSSTFLSAQTYTSATTVSAGLLNLNNSMATPTLTVADGAAVSGEPTIAAVTLGSSTGSTLYFNPTTTGALTAGTFTANGTTLVDFSAVPVGAGPFTVLNYTTNTTPAATYALANAATYRGAPTVTDNTTGSIILSGLSTKGLTWAGTTATWDANTTANWTDTATPGPLENFFSYDAVTFDDSVPGVSTTVTTAGVIQPSSITVNSATNNYTITGPIAGAGGITKAGTSTLTLGGTNTFLGPVTINGGIVSISGTNNLGSGLPGNSINLNGGTLRSVIGTDNTTLNLGITRSISVGASGGTLSSNAGTGRTTTISGPITGSGTLNFTGGGTFDVRGDNSGFNGPVNVNSITGGGATTLFLTSPLSNTTVTIEPGTVTANASNTLQFNGLSLPASVNIVAKATNDGTNGFRSGLTSNAPGGAVNGSIQLEATASPTLQQLVQFSAGGSTTVSSLDINGPVSATMAGFNGTMFIRGNGLGRINNTVNIPNGIVAKTDGGVWEINSTGNAWTSTNVLNGTVRTTIANALPATAGILMGQNDTSTAVLDFNGFNATATSLTSNPTTAGANTTGKSITSVAPATLTINQATNTTYASLLTGALSLVKSGSGTLTLTGTNTNTGTTTVSGGTLSLGSGAARGTSGITVNTGATLEFNGTNLFVANHGTAVDNARVVTVDSGTLLATTLADTRIGNITLTNGGTWTSNRTLAAFDVLLANTSTGAATVTVSGVGASTMNGAGGIHLQGVQNFNVADTTSSSASDLNVSMILDNPGSSAGAAGGVNKLGVGTMTLSAANSYAGGTTVNAGTLLVNNTTGSGTGTGAVNVSALATLGGTGTISGLTTVVSTGVLSPNTTGTIGTLTLNGGLTTTGASLVFDLSSPASSDKLDLGATGVLTSTGGLNAFTFAGTPTAGTYTLIDYGTFSGVIGDFSAPMTVNGMNASLTNDTGLGAIVLTLVSAGPDQWIGTGAWSNVANWQGAVPNSLTAVASFLGMGTGGVTVDMPQTVNQLVFNAATPSYTIAGPSTLSVAGTTPTITNTTGSNTITAPLNLANGTAITVTAGSLAISPATANTVGTGVTATVATGATLQLGGAGNALNSTTNIANAGSLSVTGTAQSVGNISGAGSTTVSGAGTSAAPTLVAKDIDQSGLTINNGAYVLIAPSGTSTSALTSLTMGATANLDISDNDVVINNPTPVAAASSLTAVAAAVNAGFASGDGIVTTTTGTGLETVGFGLNSFLSFPTFNGVTVNDDSVLIKYTYFGDSNLDGFVTDDDLGYFLAGYGSDVSANPWVLGDYNHDGFTTDDDLGFFLAAYGSTPGLAGGSIQAIPEPSTLVLGTLAGLGLGALSLRRRRAK